MRIEYIPVGDNPPESLNVIIEVPTGGEPVKYEFDKKSGALLRRRGRPEGLVHAPLSFALPTRSISPGSRLFKAPAPPASNRHA